MENGNYYKFGINTPVEKSFSDPVQCCLAGRYLNCPENSQRFDATMCNNYMVQRCAKNFDDKCDLFLKQNYERDSVRNYGDFTFVEEMAAWKYCTLDKSDPNAKCVQLCEPFNPAAQTSPTVCSIYGTEIFRKDNKLYDIAGDFNATAKLNNTSPIKISKCPIVCDGVKKVEKDDKIMNLCLATGKCQSVLQNLAKYVVEKNIPVENEGFKKWMDFYMLNNPVQTLAPNQTAVTSYALEDMIQKRQVEQAMQEAKQQDQQPPTKFSDVQAYVTDDNSLVVMTKCENTGIKIWLFILTVLLLIFMYVLLKK